MAGINCVHEKYMKEALKQAKKAYSLGEVPIGCVIVYEGKIIGRGYNRRNTDKSPKERALSASIQSSGPCLSHLRRNSNILPCTTTTPRRMQ